MLPFFLSSCNKDDHKDYGLESTILTDIDGNKYQTVIMGNQIWMGENLKTTRYNDGKSIEYPGTDNIAWENNTTGAYTWYNNDAKSYKDTYGALYNWHAVKTGKLCPVGWRVPDDDDWTKLNKYLVADSMAKLHGNSTIDGQVLGTGVANEYNFNALPGGVRFSHLPGGNRATSNGYFYYIGKTGRWWSFTEHTSARAWYRAVYPESSNIYQSNNIKETGFSVRCIRD